MCHRPNNRPIEPIFGGVSRIRRIEVGTGALKARVLKYRVNERKESTRASRSPTRCRSDLAMETQKFYGIPLERRPVEAREKASERDNGAPRYARNTRFCIRSRPATASYLSRRAVRGNTYVYYLAVRGISRGSLFPRRILQQLRGLPTDRMNF